MWEKIMTIRELIKTLNDDYKVDLKVVIDE